MKITGQMENWETNTLINFLTDEQHSLIKEKVNEIERIVGTFMKVKDEKDKELTIFWERLNLFLLTVQLHIVKEELSLFPDIMRLIPSGIHDADSQNGIIKFAEIQIDELRKEHGRIEREFHLLRWFTSDYTCLSSYSNPYSLLLESLQELEEMLLRHICIEDNLLYSRFIKRKRDEH